MDMPPVIEYNIPALESALQDEKVVRNGGVATFSISVISYEAFQIALSQIADEDDQGQDQDTGDDEEIEPADPYDVSFLFEETQKDMHWGEPFPGRARRNLAAFRAAEIDYHGCLEADLAQYEKPSVSLN